MSNLNLGTPQHKSGSYDAYPPRQQLLHHALLEIAGLVPARFQGRDVGVHVGEDGGYGGLFGVRGKLYDEFPQYGPICAGICVPYETHATSTKPLVCTSACR